MSTHSGESASGPGNAEDQSTAVSRRVLWTAQSRYFDHLTMNAEVLDRLQQNIRFFAGSLHCLHAKGQSVELREYKSMDELAKTTFAQNLEQNKPDVLIFFIPHIFEHLGVPRKDGIMRFNIGLDEVTFTWLMKLLDVHPCFIESLHYLIGHFAVFTSSDPQDKPEIIHILVKVPPAGHLEGAFYSQYNFKTKKTIMLVLGDDLQGHFELISEHLISNRIPHNPFAIILKVIMRYFRFLEAQRRQVDHAVIMTERETGRGAVAYSPGANEAVPPDKIDLTNMHWIEGNQRNIVFASQFQTKLVSFLLEEHLNFIQLRDQKEVDMRKLAHDDKLIHERFRSHETMIKGLLDMCLVVRERVQRQLSAADSIINQSDNKLSLKNAEVSTDIAEQSRRIADESREIAAETRRDSTSMKTIASLTMIYLPSTFAASIFSTGFFSYNVEGSSLVKVNPQIWKLFVVAITLTAVTLSVWVWLNKKGIPSHFDWARQKGSSETEARQRRAQVNKEAYADSTNGVRQSNPSTTSAQLTRPSPKISLPIAIPEDAV